MNSASTRLPYTEALVTLLRNIETLSGPIDITNMFPNRIEDITESPMVAAMEEASGTPPLPEDFSEAFFWFEDSRLRRCIMDAAFHKNQIVNCRMQLGFPGIAKTLRSHLYFRRRVIPAIRSVISDLDKHGKCNIHGQYRQFIVRSYEHEGTISTWIMHTEYSQ